MLLVALAAIWWPGIARAQIPVFHFSVSEDSTGLGVSPGDLLEPGYGPEVCAAVGTDIDAFSYLNNYPCLAAGTAGWIVLFYSVDRATTGFGVVAAEAARDGAAGDVFVVAFRGSFPPWLNPANVRGPAKMKNANELGLLTTTFPGVESDLDALDLGTICPPDMPYVFSEAGSPIITMVAGATVEDVEGPVTVPGDDIDALASTGPSVFLYSMRVGSPSLGSYGFEASDLLCAAPGTPPMLFLRWSDLDLFPVGTPGAPNDHVDGVSLYDPWEAGAALIGIERNPGVSILADLDAVTVVENRPIYLANFSPEDGNLQFVIEEFPEASTLIGPAEMTLLPGLPLASPMKAEAEGTTYHFMVFDEADPQDIDFGTITVISDPVVFRNGFECSTTLFWSSTVSEG